MNLLQIHEPGETPDPHHTSIAIGIDLGTTHSVIAMASGGKATVLHDLCGGVLVPSVVYYGENGEVQVGKRAVAKLQAGSKQVVSSIKRVMGKNAADSRLAGFYHAITAEDENILRFEVSGKTLTPVAVSADILRHLRDSAEKTLGQEVRQAVITVPAYFDDAARQATKDAARLAGLEVLRLVNEPTAAALAYGLDKNARGIYAIYDLGGGTFDISILKLEEGIFQVLATGGDTQLGGDDFDKAILLANGKSQVAYDPLLLARARMVKEQLSTGEMAVLEWQGDNYTVTVEQFNQLIAPLVEKTLAICRNALEDAGLATGAIDGVVLVGGSTRIPYIRKQIASLFGKTPLSDIDPDEVVAVGAAIHAEGLTGGSDNLLLDVIPLSLGLETMGGITEKIITRNTPIPVAVTQEFTTYKDAQNGMIVHVVQGERELVADNRSLAQFELGGIPALPAGIARIKITFAVDADGLLSVSAREETTGTEQSVAVRPSSGLGEAEIQQMLLESMEFAKQDIMARLLREAEIESRRSIEEIKSAFAADGNLLQQAEITAINQQIMKVENAITSMDRDRIDYECEQLHHISRSFAEKRMDRAIASALKGKHIEQIEK